MNREARLGPTLDVHRARQPQWQRQQPPVELAHLERRAHEDEEHAAAVVAADRRLAPGLAVRLPHVDAWRLHQPQVLHHHVVLRGARVAGDVAVPQLRRREPLLPCAERQHRLVPRAPRPVVEVLAAAEVPHVRHVVGAIHARVDGDGEATVDAPLLRGAQRAVVLAGQPHVELRHRRVDAHHVRQPVTRARLRLEHEGPVLHARRDDAPLFRRGEQREGDEPAQHSPLRLGDDGQLQRALAVEVEVADVQRDGRLHPLVDAHGEEPHELAHVGLGRLGAQLGEDGAHRLHHVGRPHLLAREEVEARVEDGEGHQLVFADLVVRQLGACRPRRHRRDALVARLLLQVLQQVHHHRLRQVRDDRQRAHEVAADGGVAHGLLRHVARLEEQPARRVRPVPHALRAQPRLDVLQRDGRQRAGLAQHLLRRRHLALEGVVDVHDGEGHAELLRDERRRVARALRRVARGHEEGLDGHLRSRRPAVGDEQRQERVTPARQRDADAAEAARLLEVVADAHRQRVEQVFAVALARARRRLARRQEEAAPLGHGEAQALAPRREVDLQRRHGRLAARPRLAVVAPRRVLGAQAQGALEVDHRRAPGLLVARQRQRHAAVLVDEAAAVEDQPVLRADLVDVGDGALVIARARRDQLAPRTLDPDAEGRRREVADELGARVRAASHRPVSAEAASCALGESLMRMISLVICSFLSFKSIYTTSAAASVS